MPRLFPRVLAVVSAATGRRTGHQATTGRRHHATTTTQMPIYSNGQSRPGYQPEPDPYADLRRELSALCSTLDRLAEVHARTAREDIAAARELQRELAEARTHIDAARDDVTAVAPYLRGVA